MKDTVDNNGKPPPNGVTLADVCGSIAEELASWLAGNGREDLASQVGRLMIPSQAIQGTAKEFSFMAYPIPRLTPEQRALLELRDWESIKAPMQQGSITLDLDDFGQINWVHIADLSDAYSALTALKGYIGSTS
jgi:hypothetical protein